MVLEVKWDRELPYFLQIILVLFLWLETYFPTNTIVMKRTSGEREFEW